eukprot:m.2260 g.2260  ORF g.2260 m.2260 type:complete len:188 (-) comp1043_c0_seq1:214-777(-)
MDTPAETNAPPARLPQSDGLSASAEQAVRIPAIHMRIANAFRIFDHNNNDQVDAREVGTIVRALGCCPSESDLREILRQCEETEGTGAIKYSRFESVMLPILLDRRFPSVSEDVILHAFRVLDEEGKGCFEPDKLKQILMTEGEPFTEEEAEEMMAAALDGEKKVVYYEDHAGAMCLEDALYKLASS